jgi:putative two-component system response regulator
MHNLDQIKKSHIIIIDDEEDNIYLLRRLLTKAGFTHITGLTDPVSAQEVCRFAKPDILLIDLRMPRMDGYELLTAFKSDTLTDDFIPILIFTGDLNPAARRKALELGATDFITKGGEDTEIVLRIQNFLQLRHLHRQVLQQNEILERRVLERTSDLEAARLDTLVRIAKSAECRDDATGQHTHRVGDLAASIAEQLPPGRIDPEEIRLAAPLHDVGKIGIPDQILLKPGSFTNEEYETMKTHAVLGYEILHGGPSPILQLAATIALSHHERWDGKGYPNGLIGENIPLPGRIVAIADVFDALTHERPYKRAWSIGEALNEISLGSGSQFDPFLVDIFLALPLGQYAPGIPFAA